MTWTRPLFLHLRVPAGAVADRIPTGLTLERDGADAHVSLVAYDVTGPAPSPIVASPLGRLITHRQLDLRTYVVGPHGPGLFLLDVRVASVRPLVARLAGLPVRRDRTLAFDADPAGVALRAHDLAVKGLPEPGDAHPIESDEERRLLARVWTYSRLPGALVASRVEHDPWRVRRVEIDPDLRLGIAGATLVSAQLAETQARVAIAELKVYRAAPFKEARSTAA